MTKSKSNKHLKALQQAIKQGHDRPMSAQIKKPLQTKEEVQREKEELKKLRKEKLFALLAAEDASTKKKKSSPERVE